MFHHLEYDKEEFVNKLKGGKHETIKGSVFLKPLYSQLHDNILDLKY